MRDYTSYDLIRFARFWTQNNDLKPIDAIKTYDREFPEKTPKEQLKNLLSGLRIPTPKINVPMPSANKVRKAHTFKCLICGRPVPDYEPKYCCSGDQCGCHGQPIEPCCCSRECENAVYSYIGKSFEERRLLAGIAKWSI